MSILECVLIGVGLSMDAAAVSATHGLTMKKFNTARCLVIALAFGLFQGLMPLIGYAAGSLISGYVQAFAGWFALVLLALVGGKMIWDGCKKEEPQAPSRRSFLPTVLLQAVATSIDALAVGLSLAAMKSNIFLSAGIIALTTLCISLGSVFIGHKVGALLSDKAQIAGGIILVLIGLKIAFFG